MARRGTCPDPRHGTRRQCQHGSSQGRRHRPVPVTPGPSRPGVGRLLPKLDDHTRWALRLARNQAKQLRHTHVGTEHLLTGLVEEDLSLAAQVLTSAGLTTQGCVDRLVQLVGRGGAPTQDDPPFTPRADQAIAQAHRHAISLGRRRIGSEHLLIALLDQPDNGATQLLTHARIPVEALRDRLQAALQGVVLPPHTRPSVYLSYTRPDDRHLAGRLADHLADHDIEVVEAVHHADHLLVLIGPQWTLREPMPDEFESALRHYVRVVPVLVDGAPLPDVEPFNLPTFRLVPELHHETFRQDVTRLVEALEAI
ncbi:MULTISPECIES: toll/interleukin-1 receptor domain-containing protein [unclassified Saccharothrix]|uniref:toll/interleukin-1 receptor domain-containing protein n=1 Tax=unclassified Saccharothrix TaxID=2593673 RepID=UPI00307F7111